MFTEVLRKMLLVSSLTCMLAGLITIEAGPKQKQQKREELRESKNNSSVNKLKRSLSGSFLFSTSFGNILTQLSRR